MILRARRTFKAIKIDMLTWLSGKKADDRVIDIVWIPVSFGWGGRKIYRWLVEKSLEIQQACWEDVKSCGTLADGKIFA